MRTAFRITAVFLLVSVMLGQTTSKPVLEFPVTGSPAAHAEFIKGIIALHNSAYDDAADYFRAAEKIDPAMVMAYWGEALSFNYPFQAHGQNLDAARAALLKLGPSRSARAAKAKTARERDYLAAVEDLFGDGDLDTRDQRFSDGMHKVMLAYPNDSEAAAFYVLSVLGTLKEGVDRSYTKQSASIPILKAILRKYPNHPGALHYLIHCYDAPDHAQFGLEVARHYEKIAPDISSHALHMPSHIYVQLGLWEDAKRSNEEAFAASEKHAKLKNISPEHLDYHALQWLMYSDLQLGRYKEARACADLMLNIAQQFHNGGMVGAAAELLVGPFAVETGQWDILAPFPEQNHTANLLFAQGMAAADRGDTEHVRRVVDALNHVSREKNTAGDHYETSRVDSMSKELDARLALIGKRSADAERFAVDALKFEDTVEFQSGPPDLPKPAHEFYGEVLLAGNKPEQAAEQFSIALKRAPKRALSLLGLARAKAKLKDHAGAVQAYSDISQIWVNADPTIPAVKEIHSYLGIQ